ncbi:MAG: hypothetical protein ACRDE7_00105 [Sphingobacterium sp.]
MDKPLKQKIEEAAEEYAFQVPYDGTNEFYDQTKLSGFKAGAQFLLDEGYKYTEGDMFQMAGYVSVKPKGRDLLTWAKEFIRGEEKQSK